MTQLSTSAALRQLRKLLPKTFKKVKVQNNWESAEHEQWPGYSNGSLHVNVRGVCKWRDKTTEKESCTATQIVISSSHCGVPSRYFRPRRNGTFNFDGIGTRVQAMVLQDVAYAEKVAADKAIADKKKKAEEKIRRELTKLAKQRGWDENILHEYHGGSHGECRVDIGTHRRGGSISVTIHGLSISQIDAIMENVA